MLKTDLKIYLEKHIYSTTKTIKHFKNNQIWPTGFKKKSKGIKNKQSYQKNNPRARQRPRGAAEGGACF